MSLKYELIHFMERKNQGIIKVYIIGLFSESSRETLGCAQQSRLGRCCAALLATTSIFWLMIGAPRMSDDDLTTASIF